MKFLSALLFLAAISGVSASTIEVTDDSLSVCAKECVVAAFAKADSLNITTSICGSHNFGASFYDCIKGEKCSDGVALVSSWNSVCNVGAVYYDRPTYVLLDSSDGNSAEVVVTTKTTTTASYTSPSSEINSIPQSGAPSSNMQLGLSVFFAIAVAAAAL